MCTWGLIAFLKLGIWAALLVAAIVLVMALVEVFRILKEVRILVTRVENLTDFTFWARIAKGWFKR